MTWLLGLYIVIFGAALGALLARSRLAGHVMLGIAGAAGLAYGAYQHGLLGSILPFLILIVAAVQAFSGLVANRAAKFDADEKQMLSGPLAGLGRAQARRLIDQGIWMDGRTGDVLIHEGEEAAQLLVEDRGPLDEGPGRLHAAIVARCDRAAADARSRPTRHGRPRAPRSG